MGNESWRARKSGSSSFEYGKPYRLILELDSEHIRGSVRGPGGKVTVIGDFEFTADAVNSGRPALKLAGCRAEFDDLLIRIPGRGD